MLSSVEAVLRLHFSWGCDNFLLPAPQNDLAKPGIVKKQTKKTDFSQKLIGYLISELHQQKCVQD